VAVLEAGAFGEGASSRNGGAVSGGSNLGRKLSGGAGGAADARQAARLAEAAEALALVERLIEREGIDCAYARSGRFVGAYVPAHYDALAAKLDDLNRVADAGARMVPRAEQRTEIGSDYYFGGMVAGLSGQLHPALYHRGLLEAARRAGAVLCARAGVERIEPREGGGFRLATARGPVEAGEVVVATNGYTGTVTPKLRRRIVPVASHIIATEELPEDLARGLIPQDRTINDTPRILCYYRLSPDGRRMIFGGRARFTQAGPDVSAPALHAMMTARFPQLAEARVTHAWTGNVAFAFDHLPHMGTLDGLHYCLACNGSGIAMMTYLGHRTAQRILGGRNAPASAFEDGRFESRPLYRGDPWFLPLVGSYYRARDRIDRWLAPA
jgi:glycine/D-amino acid oxidase-like deaminating enzyme